MISLLIAATLVLLQVLSSGVMAEENPAGSHGHHVTMADADPTICREAVDCLAGHGTTCAVHCMSSAPVAFLRLDRAITRVAAVEATIVNAALPTGLSPSPGDHPPRRHLV